MSLFFVDCEADGPCPGLGTLTEFGAVEGITKQTFHGLIWRTQPSVENPAIPALIKLANDPGLVFRNFASWIGLWSDGKPTFISDNPAYDWQWINYGFHAHRLSNPFGFSARRIGDYYAGLTNSFHNHNAWKRLRITRHDHNPVNDALGNAEAFDRIQRGER